MINYNSIKDLLFLVLLLLNEMKFLKLAFYFI